MADDRKFGGVTLVEGKNNGRYPFANSLLIEGSDIRAVVDPAAGRKKMRDILDAGPVDLVINTHYHEDHVTYNYMFPDANVYYHGLDSRGFENVEGMMEMGINAFLDDELREFFRGVYTERFHFSGIAATKLVGDGDEIDFGGLTAIVTHLPGHTPGHYGLLFPEEEFFFCADVDLASFGPWYGDAASSMNDIIASIKKIKTIRAKWFAVSHEGPVYEDVSGPADRYLAVIYERERRLVEALKTPRTLDELAGMWLMYGKAHDPVKAYLAAEKALLFKHLERLENEGRAKREDDIFILL